jgi:hypothetical protein
LGLWLIINIIIKEELKMRNFSLVLIVILFFFGCSSPVYKAFDDTKYENSYATLKRWKNIISVYPVRIVSIDGKALNLEKWHDIQMTPGWHNLEVEFRYSTSGMVSIVGIEFIVDIPLYVEAGRVYRLQSWVDYEERYESIFKIREESKIVILVEVFYDYEHGYDYDQKWIGEIPRYDMISYLNNDIEKIIINEKLNKYPKSRKTDDIKYDNLKAITRWKKFNLLKEYGIGSVGFESLKLDFKYVLDPENDKIGIVKKISTDNTEKVFIGYYKEIMSPFSYEPSSLESFILNKKKGIVSFDSNKSVKTEKLNPIIISILTFKKGNLFDKKIISERDRFNMIQVNKENNEKETICDAVTGLMWSNKYSEIKLDYQIAIHYCRQYNGNFFYDWRMPSVEELKTLYNNNFLNENGIKIVPYIKIKESLVWVLYKDGNNFECFDYSTGKLVKTKSFFEKHITLFVRNQ